MHIQEMQRHAYAWRSDIPLLRDIDERVEYRVSNRQSDAKPTIYLDSSATLLKPQSVIDSVVEYYSSYPSNIHRGSYHMSLVASEKYELARDIVKGFFNADESYELIFTSGMTAGSNYLSQAYKSLLNDNDVICTSILEHHSSSLPWKEVCIATGATYKEINILHDNEESKGLLGSLDMRDAAEKIQGKMQGKIQGKMQGARVLSICGMSNVNGYIPPLEQLLSMCNTSNTSRCRMIVDACQLAAHRKIDLQKTPFDALLCSAHKLGGPTGIGALCIKKEWLEELPQVYTGGGTVEQVGEDDIVYHNTVERYEPGTPNIAGAIGFAQAVQYLQERGWDFIAQYERELRTCLLEQVKRLQSVRILGDDDISQAPIISFVSPIHAQDLAFALQRDNICVRDGKLCAEPLLKSYDCAQVTRASAFCYNTKQEIEFFGDRLESMNMLMR